MAPANPAVRSHELEVEMSKHRLLLASATLMLVVSVAFAASDRHVRAPLEPNGGSGITGFVQLTQLPHGGSNLVMSISGLEPGSDYATFYYESTDCSAPADPFHAFTADDRGRATVQGKIDEDVDEVGSVSVRVGPGYGDLLACARIH